MKKIALATAENTLETHVIGWLNDRAREYDSIAAVYRDLLHGGCESGFVGELIHYHETAAFFSRFRDDINTLLVDLIQDTSQRVDEIFGTKWDNEDPLALASENQNLLAWFGFEEAARTVCERRGIHD